MRPLPVESISGTPPFVIGLAVIRGAAVPVIDVAVLLGGTRSVPTRFVTFKVGERRAALVVDAVVGVRSLEKETLRDLPPLLQDAGGGAVESIGTFDAEILIVLRAIRLVPETVWASLEQDGPLP